MRCAPRMRRHLPFLELGNVALSAAACLLNVSVITAWLRRRILNRFIPRSSRSRELSVCFVMAFSQAL
jgi:hypothetical protein